MLPLSLEEEFQPFFYISFVAKVLRIHENS